MAKKPERHVYHIDNLSLEIDYDKLAAAIVKAEKQAKEKKKVPLNLRARAMRFFNGLIYSVIYIIASLSIYVIWKKCFPSADIPLYGCIILSILLAIVGIYAFLCQQESFNDNGDDSVLHFNTNIALIALIVALVALMRGAT